MNPFTLMWQVNKWCALKMLLSDLRIDIQKRFFPRVARRELARSMRRQSLQARRILLNGRTWRQITRKGRVR